jgi:DNA-binding MarR family transcriptional regulator
MNKENDTVAKDLYHALKRLNRMMHRTGHPGAGMHGDRSHGGNSHGHHGLYRGQAYLLHTVQAHEGVVQRDLAELMDIRPSSLTEIVAKMELDGLIERRQDARDQRLQHIHLTGKGTQTLAAMDENETGFSENLFACLTEEESATLLSLCNKLILSLDARSSEEQP